MRFRASDVATATGGTLFGPDVELDGVSFDSRVLSPGQLFVAIVADRDGHEFINGALAHGAGAYLTQREPGSGTAVVVADTAAALMQLARWGRSRLDARVVGVTGSVGKTSVKDLARAALSAGLRTSANEKSFNNEQGLPVTILNSPDDTQALVLEMGMRGIGEIARLCSVGRPDIGVVTRVAEAHTELLGGIDGVARAKSELIAALPAAGVAVLNADDPRVVAMAGVAGCAVLTYGRSAQADVRIEDLVLDDLARPSFMLRSPWGAQHVRLAVSGEHMATNAAAALAVAGVCGVDLGAAGAALSEARLSPWRMEIVRNANGAVMINDAYNANPASMRAAIETLSALSVPGRRVAVLGVMAELADPVREHADIARLLSERGIELIAVGTDLYGVPARDDALAVLQSLASADAVLIKGSRVAGLDRLAALVVGE
ncbi:unannotated protein [freshwater metagenome]|uniref:UDP-MurNAc-pentapeptide synthetase n=1 Tax=freshwater metagenome TaxID=449393 RepID=A0A6J7ETS0_9ZZZZ|nr:UDP-N-acetylmuramoyl-tripeptide--D-alanyl-D-alanine ligase [Actinomycetota bacterium]